MEIGAEKGEEKGQKGKKEGIREKQVYQLSHILCDCHAFFQVTKLSRLIINQTSNIPFYFKEGMQ